MRYIEAETTFPRIQLGGQTSSAREEKPVWEKKTINKPVWQKYSSNIGVKK